MAYAMSSKMGQVMAVSNLLLLTLLSFAATMYCQSTTASPEATICTEPIHLQNDSRALLAEQDPLYKGIISIISYPCERKEIFTTAMNDQTSDFLFTVGTTVKIQCETYEGTECSSMDILRRMDMVYTEKEVMAPNLTIFTVDFLRESRKDGLYWLACQCTRVKGGTILFGQTKPLVINHKPPPVVGFHCIVNDYGNANCTWDSQKEYDVNYTACFGLKNDWLRRQANESDSEPDTVSFWNCTDLSTDNYFDIIKRSALILDLPYRMEIVGSNKYGETTKLFEYSIITVQLAPPMVELLRPIGGRKVKLKWNQNCDLNVHYSTACLLHGLLYNITLTVVEEATPDFENIFEADRELQLSGVFGGKGKGKKSINEIKNMVPVIKIGSLMPYTNYKLTMIQLTNVSSNLWSDPVSLDFMTGAISPRRGPFMHENGFAVTGKCETGRRVNIYWKGLDVHNGGNGLITEYGIKGTTETKLPSYREITTCVPENDIEISIYAANIAGNSSRHSSIVIPKDFQDVIKPCHFSVRVKKNNKVIVDWKTVANYLSERQISTANYTLFWCEEASDNVTCRNELNWIEVDGSASTQQVLSMKSDPLIYKYGIGVKYGDSKSGIIWANCITESAAPGKQDVKFEVAEKNGTYVRVYITPECRAIENINLTYCIKSGHSDNECQGKETVVPSVTIRCPTSKMLELTEKAEYLMWLTVAYADKHGSINMEPITVNMRSKYDSKEDRKIIAIILSVVGVVFLIAIAGIGIWYIRGKNRRTRRTFNPIIVKPPMEIERDISSSDYEASGEEEEDLKFLDYPYPPIRDQLVAAGLPQSSQEPDCSSQLTESVNEDEDSRLLADQRFDSERCLTLDTGLSQQHVEDSAYETNPDNSGNSLVYTQVEEKTSLPEAKPVAEAKENINEQPDSGNSFLDRISDCSNPDESGDSELFKNFTLTSDNLFGVKVRQNSVSNSGSTDFSERPLGSDYLRLDRISVNGEEQGVDNDIPDKVENNNNSPDYVPPLQMRRSTAQDSRSFPAEDDLSALESAYSVTGSDLNTSSAAFGDFNSGSTGHHAIELSQWI